MWLLLGYPSNILGYRSKYWNYTSKTKLGRFPHSPGSSPPVDNFFTLRLTKNIIEHERCRIRFYNGFYTCLISVLINNKCAIYIFKIFEFGIFLFSNIAILAYIDPKLPFLSLKFPKKKIQYFIVCYFWELKNSSHTQTFKYMSRAQFSS